MRNILLLLFFIFLIYGCGSKSESQVTPYTVTPTTTRSSVITPTIKPSVTPLPTVSDKDYQEARERMVLTGIVGWGIKDEAVIEVMGVVPRHEFVPDEYLSQAYANHALPIGYGQTISQPFIVALMTQELGVSKGDRVLEIGTGSGYQAAVLAQLGIQVFTIEIIGPLAELAEERFQALGYSEIIAKQADGYYGWEEESPFDAIIVTAAPDHVPQPLLAQLIVGGILVIPVGPVGGFQELWRIKRIDETTYQSASLGGVMFVPLTRIEESP
jgi:protein-L-isoaspartate(D-aspartate) O-methyltransferase